MASEQINEYLERKTELRHLKPNQLRQIAVRMDEHDGWQKLLEKIPKKLNTQESSHVLNWEVAIQSGYKFTEDHIREIKRAVSRYDDGLCGQILLEEWSTMGKKEERPTVGVLLELLIKAELFRAADYVAEMILNEPKPQRPENGPAARIDLNAAILTEALMDVDSMVNDSSNQPDTNDLLRAGYNDDSESLINKDYFEKCAHIGNKNVVPETLSNTANASTPKPPPRSQRKTESFQQNLENSREVSAHQPPYSESVQSTNDSDIPRFSLINQSTNDSNATSKETLETYVTSSRNCSGNEELPQLTAFLKSSTISRSQPLIPSLFGDLQSSTEHTESTDANTQNNGFSITILNGLVEMNVHGTTESRDSQHGDDNGDSRLSNDYDNNNKSSNNYNDTEYPNLSIFEESSSDNNSSFRNISHKHKCK